MTQESLSSSRLPAFSAENSRAILAITRTSACSNMLVAVSRRKTINSGCPLGRLTLPGSLNAAEIATLASGGRPGSSRSSVKASYPSA